MRVRPECGRFLRDGGHVPKRADITRWVNHDSHPRPLHPPCDPRASLSREVLLYISPSYVPVMQHEPVSPSSGSWSHVLSRLLRLRSELQTVLSGQLKRNPLPPPASGSWKASPCRLGAATRRLLDWERSGPKTVRRQIFVRRLSTLNYLELVIIKNIFNV